MSKETIQAKIAAIESDPLMVHLPVRQWNRYLKLLSLRAELESK